ncbi:MAG TPA: cardiolipin synthase, partial [Terrimicrobiaceae bacterium]|nr:cardiolipin synthase [Terrimicrobiaceae bacterium]
LASGCASLPDVALHLDGRHATAVELKGARGPLSAQQSAAILKELERKSGAFDILQKHVALEEAVVGSSLVVGNKVVLLQDGPATYEAMFAAIRKATNHINLETYIFEDDEIGRQFADLLLEKQMEGIQVNLIYDSVGSLKTPKSFFDRLKQAGIAVTEFNPVNPLAAKKGWQINKRDHRKLLLIDGHTAFLGGVNISSVYSSGSAVGRSDTLEGESISWRDTHVQIEGPVVADFQKLFLETWDKQKGEPVAAKEYFPALKPRGNEIVRAIGSAADEPPSLIYLTLLSAIANAEKHVYLTNAYFVPDSQLLTALTTAARRGVEVKLILPSQTDMWVVFHAGRSHYSDLLDAGVRIYERRGMLLHTKTAVIDGVWSCVGSTNLDWRSFLHNDELNAVILGHDFAQQMQAVFERDLEASDAIDPERWKYRPLHFRLQELGARLWEYWL